MPGAAWQQAVVIEVRDGGAGPVQAAVSSCNRALGAGRCWDNRSEGLPRADWHAIVTWPNEERLRARVELHQRANGFRLMAAREVDFVKDDTLEERYRAVGLIAAAQVVALTRIEQVQPTEPDEEPVDRVGPEPRPGPATPPRPSTWGFDAGGFAGPGLDEGAPRVGLFARPWTRLGTSVSAIATLRGALRAEDDPRLGWASLGFGLSTFVTPEHGAPGAELRAELMGQWVRASAEDPETGREDAASALRWGPLLGLDLVWPTGAPIALVLGGEVSLLFPKLSVELRGEDAGTEADAVWAFVAGVRLAP